MAVVHSRPARRRSSSARKGLATLGAMTIALACDDPSIAGESQLDDAGIMTLPPASTGTVTLDYALRHRRSIRSFSAEPLSLGHVGQLCWAAQGVTEPTLGHRTAPSAGALYPLELYVVLPSGVFHYEPRHHRLKRVGNTDRRTRLARAALGQDSVRLAGVNLVITAVVSRTRVYHDRAERYVHLEAGHAAENVLLEATALGLGTVPIGAFDDAAVRRAIGAPLEETPLYILSVGHPAD